MLRIKEEFKRLIPELTPEEFKQLEDNCMAEGIREKIITWNGYIIDGHNRYHIAHKWDLEYETESKYFDSEDDVKIWMIANQLGRRNLIDFVKGELHEEMKKILKEIGKQKQLQTLKQNENKNITDLSIVDKTEAHNTREIISEKLGWGTGKKARFDVVVKKAPEEVKEKLRSGEISINQAYTDIKKQEKKEEFEKKKTDFEKPIEVINTRQIIIKGDSIQVLPTLQDKSFDLLLTDPPYGMDFKSGWNDKNKIKNDKINDTIKLLDEVLSNCVPLLKDDAHFYLFGNIEYISDVRPIIEKYLNLKNVLIWDRAIIGMGDLKSYGKSYDVIYFGYNKVFKELNGTRDRDVLKFNRVDPSKNIHPTEKPIDLLEYLIKKSSKENENILEPFAGGGSTLLACKKTNRLCTGIEIEQNYYDLIKSRI